MIDIQYKDDVKNILKQFESLTPWDKNELIKYLADKLMTEDEIEKYFIEGSRYVDYNDIDFVKEVIDHGQESEVLDEMDDMTICDYIMDNYSGNGKSNLEYILERLHWDDAADAIYDMNRNCLYDIIDAIQKRHPKLINKIKNYIKTGVRDD